MEEVINDAVKPSGADAEAQDEAGALLQEAAAGTEMNANHETKAETKRDISPAKSIVSVRGKAGRVVKRQRIPMRVTMSRKVGSSWFKRSSIEDGWA